MRIEQETAQRLRGAFWNGIQSPLVRFTGKEKAPGAVELPGDSPASGISGDVLPSLVYLEGAGTFALGANPDQLERNAGGGGEAVVLPRDASRCDTVRGKVALVTGGAQGFGREIVLNLVSDGAYVWIADLNLDGARKLAEEINLTENRLCAFAVSSNVADEESVRQMMETLVESMGGIDLLISNAGVLKAGSVKELSFRDFTFVTSVNYTGYFLCVKHAAPVMAAQHAAAPGGDLFTDIIQINSKSGLEGSNKNGAYAGGKFGGIGLTQSFALELVTDNIKVNSICPGNFFDGPLWSDPDRGLFVQYLNTGKVPGAKSIEDVKKFYEAKVPMNRGCGGDDVYKAILYCIEQKYETGQAVPVTGGQVMLS
jgi:sorbitol-6-phosphate 2-dehydrogenase